MKRAIIASALAIMIMFAAFVPGFAEGGQKKEIRVVLIISDEAIKNSSENASLLDRALDAVTSSGHAFAFFFNSRIEKNGDAASALMKAYCANVPIGIYDESGGQDAQSVYDMLIFEKYVTKTVSRLLLTGAGSVGIYEGEFAVFSSGLVVPPSFSLAEQNLNNYENVTISIRISEANIVALESFLSMLDEYDMSFVTATETGFR